MTGTDMFLRFDHVQKRFGDALAVEDFHLDVERGSFVAIMGPSGCGKTTTLRMLAGLETPTSGEIFRDGAPISGTPPWRRRMPLVWQNYALFPFLTVRDNVAFGLRNDKVTKAERNGRAQTWLDRLGIGELAQRYPDTLSGGQAQRVALARALVLEPEILLLDEPLSALDANMVVRMQSELAELQKALGITFIYVTHNQSEAFAMADRVVIMNGGRIEQAGSPMDIYRGPKTRFVAQFVGTNNILDGKLTNAGGTRVKVATALGDFVSDNGLNPPVKEGQDVHLVVGADLVSIDRPGDTSDGPDRAGVNRLNATLIGESFAGNMVTLVFETRSGAELKVQVPQRAYQELGLKPREDAGLAFGETDALVIPAGRTRPQQ